MNGIKDKFWYVDRFDDWDKLPIHFNVKRYFLYRENTDTPTYYHKSYFTVMTNISQEDVTYLTIMGIQLREVTEEGSLEKFKTEYSLLLNSWPLIPMLIQEEIIYTVRPDHVF